MASATCIFLHTEIVEDTGCRFATFPDSRYDQIRTAYHITTSEDFGITGLKFKLLMLWSNDTAPVIGGNVVIGEPGWWIGPETEGDQYHVSRQNLLAARYNLWTATTFLVRFTQLGRNNLHAFYLTFADYRDRLTVKQELHTLFPGIGYFPLGAWHIFFVATVRTGDAAGALTKDRKSTRLNSSHVKISYAVFCLKKKIID